ncbi:histidinol-phosphatase [Rudanella paleaurantiibacter]|uniref:protein-tyrosine-phosphatase n=1 Tax=Rudanella paleaurantiibacter TaxID=2614655 RepID=A0A7J5U680_9BACT|nr:CpsB/CapC family capsule biosynthesis tyrosine phosphatase [Rudanella paleaurantiibacter]KAB7733286.1 histidinol-phosphatase [Rudanella paleaurantiibacter]
MGKPDDGPFQERMAATWPVDMHNHLLPGVDDGVKTLDETMTCLRQYAQWGIRRVVCTPHISQDYHPNTVALLREKEALVRAAIADAELPITFSVAAEYLLDENFDHQLRTDSLMTFGEAQYVLIETGWAAAPRQLTDWIFAMQVKGYTPVLAHPERYRYYQTEPYLLKQLRAQGCHMQLNLLSLTGRYGSRTQRFAQLLLQEHCVDFLGSDLHREADLACLPAVFTSADWDLLSKQPLVNQKLL